MGVTLTVIVRSGGGFCSIKVATSPSVWAPLRLTMLVFWPSEMAMLPAATPWPPLSVANGVLEEESGVSADPSTGWDMAPKAWAPVTLVGEKLVQIGIGLGRLGTARVDDVPRGIDGKWRRGRVRAAEQLLAVELCVAQRDQLLDGLVDLLDDGLALRSVGRRADDAEGGGLDRGQEAGNAGKGRIGLTQIVLIGADVRLKLRLPLHQALDALHLQGGERILARQLELVAGADLRFQLRHLRLVGVELAK